MNSWSWTGQGLVRGSDGGRQPPQASMHTCVCTHRLVPSPTNKEQATDTSMLRFFGTYETLSLSAEDVGMSRLLQCVRPPPPGQSAQPKPGLSD